MHELYWQDVRRDTPSETVPVTHPWKRGEAKGLPPTTASLNLSLKEPSPVPPRFPWLAFTPLWLLDT